MTASGHMSGILGAKAQTRTGILGTGTAFDVQKQFLENVEDAILSPVDLPSAISRYQDVLKYAGSEVNYVFGIGLYMAPGDMLLRINQAWQATTMRSLIAMGEQPLGLNSGVNLSAAPPDAYTGETGIVKPVEAKPSPTSNAWGLQVDTAHADEMTALIVGGIAIGLAVLWLC